MTNITTEIQAIFSTYAESVADLVLYEKTARITTRSELYRLQERQRMYRETIHGGVLHGSFNYMYFQSAVDGKLYRYADRTLTHNQHWQLTFRYQNKQYQWLMSASYELFEKLLERIYAAAGQKNHNLWPLSDFGSASFSDLPSKKYAWYIEMARKKKDRPQSILNTLRAKIPGFSDVEKSNAIGVDLRLHGVLVEQLRHLVVHTGGETENIDGFVHSVLGKMGYSINGIAAKGQIKIIKSFFAEDDDKTVVTLLDQPATDNGEATVSLYSYLTDNLYAYADLIRHYVSQYLQ